MTKKTTKAPAKTPEAPAAKPKAAERLLVIVGGRGAAGRIMLGTTIYDTVKPQPMSRADFDRLKARYDLREVKPK